VSDAQVRKLMEEMSKHGRIGRAAMKAGMDRKTARKYIEAGRMPSEMVAERTWRTREDPFAEDWEEIEALLKQARRSWRRRRSSRC
jgi:molybdenum-dependent DNA-binding transcriptional regulator ModE